MALLPRDHERYDQLFREAICGHSSGHYDWLQIKAQAVQESQLDPRAKSHVGARGLMQIMPPTGLIDLSIYGKASKSELREKKREAEADGWARFFDPEISIRNGIEYMARQQRFFHDVKSAIPRWLFCLSAYNAGAGHVIRAQRKARELGWDGSDYHAMAACLPRITGQHAAETLNYVTHILEFYKALLAAQGAAAKTECTGQPREET